MRDIVEKNENFNLHEAQLELLKSKFPQCFLKDGSFDIKRFEEELTSNLNIVKEGYSHNWLGKSYAKIIANLETETLLSPILEHNSKKENKNSSNIYIKGDNLDVLKHLVNAYSNEIKLIYIDPPYNTESDEFVYQDDFKFTPEKLAELADLEIDEAARILDFTDRKSSSHSAWLTFMYPRLFVARELLADDGVIFISIDENEYTQLKLLCDEIFGEANFIESIVWNKRVPKNDKGIGNIHEYVLVYKKKEEVKLTFMMPKEGLDEINELVDNLAKKKVPIPEAEKELKKFYKKKGYDRGITLYNSLTEDYEIWGKINLSWPNGNTVGPKYEVLHPITKKPVKVPDRGWRWTKTTFDDYLDDDNIVTLHDGSIVSGEIWFAKDENTQPSHVKKLKDVDSMLLRSIISLKSDGGMELERLFEGKSYFSYPKPTSLMKYLIRSVGLNPNDVVLDFFAGSSTTADAVMQLNIEEQLGINYILVQLPEKTKEDSIARTNGYDDLSQIGIDRIIKAAESIKIADSDIEIDYGFKVFETIPLSDNTLDKMENFTGEMISTDEIMNEIGLETILTTWMLQDGHKLTTECESINLGNYDSFKVESTLYLLNKSFTIEENFKSFLEKLEKEKDFVINKIVVLGYSFDTQTILSLKENVKHLINGRKSADVSLEVRY
ncbi:DNA methyltransferase [Cytobacillus pseudoceanisediminis]